VKPAQKLSFAICSVLGIHGASTVMATEATGDSSKSLLKIVVTAQRREENIQNEPITIQALTGEAIAQLNVSTGRIHQVSA
jgi:iron complex outermembrane recepter protein